MAGSGDRLHTSWVTVTTRLLSACARSCACVWVEGGVKRKRERAWQMVQAGRWCISVGSSADTGVEFHAKRKRERGKQPTSTPTNPTRSLPLMPRSASGHRNGCCFLFFILALKKGSKSCLLLADCIVPSCPRKDFSSELKVWGRFRSVSGNSSASQPEKWIKFDIWNQTTITPVHPLAQAEYQLWWVPENEHIQPLTLLRLPYRQSRMCSKCECKLPWRRRLVEAWLISDLFSKARKWENTTVQLIFVVSIRVWIEATAGRCVVFRCVCPFKNPKRSYSYTQTITGLLDIKL